MRATADFAKHRARHLARLEPAIDRWLPPARTRPRRLHEAMRYAMQPGGKRLRPVLLLGAADLFDPSGRTDPLPAAIAVECVHAYSLVHDDLPCMDNDDLRRGRPTCHKAFDEATALLAGDALLTLAFDLLASHYPPEPGLALVRELATAAGSRRLVGGQQADLLAEKRRRTGAAEVEFIHLNKTAALIQAPLVMGGRIGGAAPRDLEILRRAGRELGLAFQIVDDILDATSDAETLGKTPGKDAQAGKATFVSVHGLAASRRFAAAHASAAVAALRRLPGETQFLAALADSLTGRRH
jgi:geranylgeranyl diphosphate synthase, type II